MKQAVRESGSTLLRDALARTETRVDDYHRILVHQVSMAALDDLIAFGGLPRERVEVTVPEYGNMAAASLPVACALAEEQGRLQPGDRVMWLGLAAGISLGVVLMRY